MKLLHSFCDPTDTMPTVTSFNGRFIDSEGKNYYDISAGKGCNVLGFNNEYIQYHISHAHRVWPSNDWNAKPDTSVTLPACFIISRGSSLVPSVDCL